MERLLIVWCIGLLLMGFFLHGCNDSQPPITIVNDIVITSDQSEEEDIIIIITPTPIPDDDDEDEDEEDDEEEEEDEE